MMERPVPVGTRVQLLVDDYLIEASEGLATVCHGPYRAGRSRQGAPVRRIQRIPLTIRR